MANGVQPIFETEDRGRYVRLHPAWAAFIRFCQDLRYGEVERLKIQDGLPVIAEEVRRKIRFAENGQGERS
jgi:hypothetical protein